MMLRTSVLAVTALAAVGCDQRAAFDRLVPKDDAAFVIATFDELRQGNVGAVETLLDSATRTATAPQQLEQMALAFGGETPRDVQVIGALTNIQVGDDTRYVTLTLEYRLSQHWLVATMALRRSAGARRITGMRVLRTVDSQERLNRFTLENKGVGHYVMLLLSLVVPLSIVGTLAVWWRTPMPRRKWLWGIFIALGIGKCTLNWTTGQVGFELLRVLFLGAGFVKAGPYGPVVLSVAVPAGALIFLARRRKWLANMPLQPTSGIES
jgi:hypothetical protein